jgi:hypothetical protein
MLLKDHFELPVTCVSVAAVEDYVAAVDLLLSAWPGAEGTAGPRAHRYRARTGTHRERSAVAASRAHARR